MKQLFLTMTRRLPSGRADAPPSYGRHPGVLALCGGVLLLLLGWSSASPARAEGGLIDYPRTGPINVYAGETLTIADGGSVSGNYGVSVYGGMLIMAGGSINASILPISVNNAGSATISGGIVSGGVSLVEVGGVNASGGSVSITGGSMGSSAYGLIVYTGTASVTGCSLAAVNVQLTGTLQDGTPINIPASGAISLVGDTTPPTLTPPDNITQPADPGQCSARINVGTATAVGACKAPLTTAGTRSDGNALTDPYPIGTTSITWIVTDPAGTLPPATQTVSVTGADLVLTMGAIPASSAQTGSILTYSLGVQNTGNQTAQGVVLTDLLPAGTSFVGATVSPSGGTLTTPRGKSSTVSWSAPSLGSGKSVTLTIAVKISAKAGTILSNTASVSSNSECDLSNNSAGMTTTVTAKR
jgi:uncharacterized repeat protein (TIGR01451 family)